MQQDKHYLCVHKSEICLDSKTLAFWKTDAWLDMDIIVLECKKRSELDQRILYASSCAGGLWASAVIGFADDAIISSQVLGLLHLDNVPLCTEVNSLLLSRLCLKQRQEYCLVILQYQWCCNSVLFSCLFLCFSFLSGRAFR